MTFPLGESTVTYVSFIPPSTSGRKEGLETFCLDDPTVEVGEVWLEEGGGVGLLALELPVEPAEGKDCVAATVGLTIGATMTRLGVVGKDYRHFADRFVVDLCVLVCHIGSASSHVEDGLMEIEERCGAGSRHAHLAHAGIEDDTGFDG